MWSGLWPRHFHFYSSWETRDETFLGPETAAAFVNWHAVNYTAHSLPHWQFTAQTFLSSALIHCRVCFSTTHNRNIECFVFFLLGVCVFLLFLFQQGDKTMRRPITWTVRWLETWRDGYIGTIHIFCQWKSQKFPLAKNTTFPCQCLFFISKVSLTEPCDFSVNKWSKFWVSYRIPPTEPSITQTPADNSYCVKLKPLKPSQSTGFVSFFTEPSTHEHTRGHNLCKFSKPSADFHLPTSILWHSLTAANFLTSTLTLKKKKKLRTGQNLHFDEYLAL